MAISNNFKQFLPERLAELLDKGGIEKPEEIIIKSDLELKNLLLLTQSDIEIIRQVAASSIINTTGIVTVAEVLFGLPSRWRKLSVGCRKIDSSLGGGLSCRGITEISGASGVGKTQLCLQAAISVQYPKSCGGLKAGAVFVCTEDAFPTKRLQQLFHLFPSVFLSQFDNKNELFSINNFGDNIFIEHTENAEALIKCVVERLPALLALRNIGLIVIDSIGAAFRTEAVSPYRSNQMRMVAMTLHDMATKYDLAVICVNQVSAVVNSENDKTVPSLGLSWANLVTTRLVLSRENHNVVTNGQKTPIVNRQLKIIFSPDIAQNCTKYKVEETGVWGLP